jgi:hypothetical protein
MIISIIIVFIVAVPFIVAFYTDKEFAIEREVTINKPIKEIFNYLKLLKTSGNYNV